MTARQLLRLGLVVDSLDHPGWVAAFLQELEACSTRLVAVVMDGRKTHAARRRSGEPPGSTWLFRLYARLDRWAFRSEPDALSLRSIAPLIADCPRLLLGKGPVVPRADAHADPDTLRDLAFDVLLDLRSHRTDPTLGQFARHGIWTYASGEHAGGNVGPAGFWEVMHRQSVTTFLLLAYQDDASSARVLQRSLTPTDPRSAWRNANAAHWKLSATITRTLRDLVDGASPAAASSAPTSPRQDRPSPPYPSNSELPLLLAGVVARYVRDKFRSVFFAEQYCIATISAPNGLEDILHASHYSILQPPRDRSWADPFPVEADGGYYIFLEEAEIGSSRGKIAMINVQAKSKRVVSEVVLERDYHMSYPHVFTFDGRYYMIPETYEANKVELYRSINFPYSWELDTTLIDEIRAIDSTCIEINSIWWLFTSIQFLGMPNFDELHLFYANHPRGPWQPHPRNPVKSDPRSTRPAGRIFCEGGRYYRPAQDSSTRYGYAIVINRIEQLSTDNYSEVEVARIPPVWTRHLLGTHTLNFAGGLACLDGVRRVRRWPRRVQQHHG